MFTKVKISCRNTAAISIDNYKMKNAVEKQLDNDRIIKDQLQQYKNTRHEIDVMK